MQLIFQLLELHVSHGAFGKQNRLIGAYAMRRSEMKCYFILALRWQVHKIQFVETFPFVLKPGISFIGKIGLHVTDYFSAVGQGRTLGIHFSYKLNGKSFQAFRPVVSRNVKIRNDCTVCVTGRFELLQISRSHDQKGIIWFIFFVPEFVETSTDFFLMQLRSVCTLLQRDILPLVGITIFNAKIYIYVLFLKV